MYFIDYRNVELIWKILHGLVVTSQRRRRVSTCSLSELIAVGIVICYDMIRELYKA